MTTIDTEEDAEMPWEDAETPWDFPTASMVPFVLREEGGIFVAENEDLGTFGAGPSETDAIRDFLSSVIDLWHSLSDSPDSQLTADAVDLKERLAEYLACDLVDA